MNNVDVPTAEDACEMVLARRSEIINALLNRIGAAVRISVKKMIRVELREDDNHVVNEVIEHLKKLGYSTRYFPTVESIVAHLTITWRDELRSR